MISAPVKFQKLICQNPYFAVAQKAIFPCGKCVLCRSRRGRQWSHRLSLESTDWRRVSHVTLTYAPRLDGYDMNFNYSHFQLFMKKFRKFLDSIGYHKIKFFCAGERGENGTQRVHYHVLLFGIDATMRDTIAQKWEHGFVKVKTVESSRGMRKVASYVSQYVLKKIGDKRDGIQHCSRGIGLRACIRLFKDTFLAQYQKFGDFKPIVWQGEVLRFDRYLKTKVAESLGVLDEIKSRWKQNAQDFFEEVLSIYDTFSQDYVFGRPAYPVFTLSGFYESVPRIDWTDFTCSQLFTRFLEYVNKAVEFVGAAKFETYKKQIELRKNKNNRGLFANVSKKVI